MLVCLIVLTGNAQDSPDKVITLSEKKGKLAFFLKEISENSSYSFAFITNDIDEDQVITFPETQTTIKNILDVVSKKLNLQYEIKGQNILLKSRKKRTDTITISGLIKDKFSGEALPGGSVYIHEQNTGTTSNTYGFYSITLPKGTYKIASSFIGYQTLWIDTTLSASVVIDLELLPQQELLHEVVIDAEKENGNITSNTLGLIKPDLHVIRNMPAFMGETDIVKSIIQLPGVTTVGEAAPGFNVRGGGIDQNLILLDEAPVYNSSHLFGFFSVFNADAIKDMRLYKGGIPANYGGRLSSVLDITQKEGNNQTFQGSGGIGIVSSRLQLEGPIAKNKSSYLVTARRSYADLFIKEIGDVKVKKAYFYDLNAKLNYIFNEKNTLLLSGYFGKDSYNISDNIDVNWGNITTTLRWNHLFGNKLFSNITAVYSDYSYNQGSPDSLYAYEGQRQIISYNLKADFSWYCASNHRMDFGVSSLFYKFNPGKVTPVNTSLINTLALDNEHAAEYGVYVSDEYVIHEKLTLSTGIRYSAFQNIGPTNVILFQEGVPKTKSTIADTVSYSAGEVVKAYHGVEPRLSLNFQLNDRSALRASYNRTRQYLHFISNTTAATPVDFWKPSGRYIKPETADQYALGYVRNLKDNMLQFSIEGYYKKIHNILDFKNGADLLLNAAMDAELLQGTGRAYGIELMLNKTKGQLTGWAGYTYSRTERLVNGPSIREKINNGKYYPSNYDQPHKINWVASYDANKRWTFSANFTYTTGRPITYPDGGLWLEGKFVPLYIYRNQNRIPDYHRLDIAATWTPAKRTQKKWEGSWNFTLYNVYARQNAYSVYFRPKLLYGTYSSRATEAVKLSILGSIFPSVTYNFKF